MEWEHKTVRTADKKGRLHRAYARGGGDVSPSKCSRNECVCEGYRDMDAHLNLLILCNLLQSNSSPSPIRGRGQG